MTKKRVLLGLLALLSILIAYLLYVFVLSPKTNLQSIYLIPKDAVFVIESEKPVESWEKVSESEAWHHLQENGYFAELTEDLQKVDAIFQNQKRLIDFFDERSLFISVHMISAKDYGLFFVLDLKQIAQLQLLKTYLNTVLDDDYSISKRNYHKHEILEIFDRVDKETMYISFIKNQMIASSTHTLVEASIDQYEEPALGRNLDFIEINKKVGYENLFRLYMQYDFLDDYALQFSKQPTDWITQLSKNFLFSGFNFEIDDHSTLTANGFTNLSTENESYLEALQKSGKAERSIPKIAPKRTAVYISYGFDSFLEFYDNLETVWKENNTENHDSYLDGIRKVEDFLKINVEEHFVEWIGDEIGLLQIKSNFSKNANDMALVIKANDIEAAKTNLDFVLKQIKKKTPVKFKAITYKEHQINFLSIKGFFKLLLGSRFKEFDKPYFTIIDDYVVFSNNPNTLKSIITDFIEKETLSTSEDFTNFNEKFEDESSLFVYSNTALLYNNMYALADRPTKVQMKENKDFIVCFPQMGFQLTPEDNLFKSLLIVDYEDIDELKKKASLLNKIKAKINPKSVSTAKVTDAVFNLKPIYPKDLNAKEYSKNYTNGKRLLTVELKDGLKHGRYTQYYSNGVEKITGRYRKGKQVGAWRYYNEEGDLLKKKRF